MTRTTNQSTDHMDVLVSFAICVAHIPHVYWLGFTGAAILTRRDIYLTSTALGYIEELAIWYIISGTIRRIFMRVATSIGIDDTVSRWIGSGISFEMQLSGAIIAVLVVHSYNVDRNIFGHARFHIIVVCIFVPVAVVVSGMSTIPASILAWCIGFLNTYRRGCCVVPVICEYGGGIENSIIPRSMGYRLYPSDR